MKNRLFGKMMLSFAISVLLLLPSAGLANVKAGSLHTPPSLVPVKDEVLDKYSQLAAKYLTDCADLDVSRPSGEKLKRCLTIVKELRDKFDGLLQRLESITGKVKKEKRWTKELDDEFEKNAAKGGDSNLINQVKQQGGFRAFYQKSITELKGSKPKFDAEVEELEKESQQNAFSGSQAFQMISYASRTSNVRCSVLCVVHQVVMGVIRAVCNAFGGGC